MRVSLLSYGTRGDVDPVVSLAVRLRELGADARVCAPPDFGSLLDRVGVPFTPFGWSMRALAKGEVPDGPTCLPELAEMLPPLAFDAVLAQDCDVVLGAGSFPAAAGAQAAAERLGVRYVYATFSPCYLPSAQHRPAIWSSQVPDGETDNRVLWDLNARHLHALMGEPINEHRVSVGLPAVPDIRTHVFTGRPVLAADPVLGPWWRTPDLDVAQTGAWLRRDDRALPADLAAFLDAGARPVYVGFGSMPMHGADAADVSRAAVHAARAQGRRVLLGSGWAGLAAVDDRSDCFVVGEVNQQELFRRVAAVVHHGGAGTTTAAAVAGAPQVLVPQVADQPYWARQVTELGIGAGHDGATPTVQSLSDVLATVLEPDTLARAKAVAATMPTDGATVAARQLLNAGAPATGRAALSR